MEKQIELDPYEILQVNYDASLNEIREAFKKLVLIHHPDRGGNPRSFHIIKGAYSYIYQELKKQEKLENKEKQTYNNYKQHREEQTEEYQEEIQQEQNNQPLVSSKNFNVSGFNKLFNNYRVEDINDHGYGQTMLSNGQTRLKDNSLCNSNINQFQKRNLMIYEKPESMTLTDNYHVLGGEKITDYTSGFNINDNKKKIAFTDYMRAHSECEQISSNTKNVRQDDYNSMDQLINRRSNISHEISDQDKQKISLRKKKELYKEKMRILRLHEKEQEIIKKHSQRQSFIRYN